MNKVLIILIPLILLFAGCTQKENEATGQAITVKEIHVNYPVELKDYISGLGNGKFVLTSNELAFLKTGEKISVEVNKRGIPQYAFIYELILPQPLNIGESADSYWFHEKAVINYTSSNTASITMGEKIIQLKNFNEYQEISKGNYNAEFLKKNEQLIGLKIYNTQQISADSITNLYNS
ncbi:MAG: hypothetical protein COT90_03785 [Candidatus Diapherotrites archaeon CG10_big_fil_rev_8_21_14_0_10_31_34]|nr:MAG: hypothetical protein COT90_03785 [Candidatus Diapherotrites archaeon CG10_big_fil_rev_8_21_14_0_10_31_34]